MDVLLICLAPEVDLKYETLYAYLQNDVTKKPPGVNLILDILCHTDEKRINARTYFSPQAPLLKYALIKFTDGSEQKPLLSKALKLDDRIVDFLLGFNLLDSRLVSFTETLIPRRDWATVMMEDMLKGQLSRLSQEYFKDEEPKKLLFYFYGSSGSGKKLAAEAFCYDLQLPLLIADMRELLHTRDNIEQAVDLLFREALLQPAAIYLEHFDALLTEDPKDVHYHKIIMKAIEEFSMLTFLAGEKSLTLAPNFKRHTFIKLEFPLPAYSLRKCLWEVSLDNQNALFPEVNTAILANTFRFTGGKIQDAIADAKNLALMHQHNDNSRITMEDLYHSCRAQSNQKLSKTRPKDHSSLHLERYRSPRRISCCNSEKSATLSNIVRLSTMSGVLIANFRWGKV